MIQFFFKNNKYSSIFNSTNLATHISKTFKTSNLRVFVDTNSINIHSDILIFSTLSKPPKPYHLILDSLKEKKLIKENIERQYKESRIHHGILPVFIYNNSSKSQEIEKPYAGDLLVSKIVKTMHFSAFRF